MNTHEPTSQATTTSVGEAVATLYADLKRGDMPAVLNRLDESIAWTVPPCLYYAGTHRGREAVLKNVFSTFTTDWDGFAVTPTEIFDTSAEGVVIVLGHYSGTSRTTGKPMTTRFTHVWRMQNGRAVTFETIFDTRTLNAAQI
ncbi:nuclear transport factor 2 family protein [Streptomyces sp. NPDC057199]|uniref:nuclear transport factor 2 family protein n=1 Tax=Streptomyces sp. NPDC057199 TaxID=3346047 RepID=UPI003644F3EA